MPFDRRLLPSIQAHCPFRLPTPAANLARLVGALLRERPLNLTALATAFPIPRERPVPRPKHEPLPRLKRLARFRGHAPVDPVAGPLALVPTVLARRGHPRRIGRVVDWTRFETALPPLRHCAGRRSYPGRTIGGPRRGRARPLLRVAHEPGRGPAPGSPDTVEHDALARGGDALPPGVRAGVVGDRALGRAARSAWRQERRVDDVRRLKRGALLTQGRGIGRKLGEEGMRRGAGRGVGRCRDGTDHAKPRDLRIHRAGSWRFPQRRPADRKGKGDQEPGDLAPGLTNLGRALAWDRQRRGSEESFKDGPSPFRLDPAPVARAGRRGRLVAALRLALAWLPRLARPTARIRPPGGVASVVTDGRASAVSLALAFLDPGGDFPPRALPATRPKPA